jgi:acyl-CoA thioesterase II
MANTNTLPPLSDAQIQARRDLLAAERAKLTPAQAVANLLALFALEEVKPDLYRVSTGDARGERLFGGQVIAQAMMAALKSAPADKVIHSLHAYFLRGGSDQVPVDLAVNRDFDGRSFANRRVVAAQDGKVILNLAASFQLEQPGLDFQVAMPDVPAPDDCHPDYAESLEKPDVSDQQFGWYARVKPIEIRNIDARHSTTGSPRPNRYAMWFRAAAPLPDNPLYHYAALAYASDYGLLGSSWMVHRTNGWSKHIASASLDHAIWFHARPKADDWMLYWMDCQWTGGARGINRGQIFAQDGTLMASTMQEGMIRAG